MLLLARIVRIGPRWWSVSSSSGRAAPARRERGNALVGFVYDVANWLVGPFKGLFSLDDGKATIAVNWGIAAIVYGIVGALISRLLAGAGLAARDRFATRRRTVA